MCCVVLRHIDATNTIDTCKRIIAMQCAALRSGVVTCFVVLCRGAVYCVLRRNDAPTLVSHTHVIVARFGVSSRAASRCIALWRNVSHNVVLYCGAVCRVVLYRGGNTIRDNWKPQCIVCRCGVSWSIVLYRFASQLGEKMGNRNLPNDEITSQCVLLRCNDALRIASYCVVLCCAGLCCTALYCIVPSRCVMMHCSVLRRIGATQRELHM